VTRRLPYVSAETRAAIVAAWNEVTYWDGIECRRYSLPTLAEKFGLKKTQIDAIIREAGAR